MARFTISFETDPETCGPWQGRQSARVKMMQSISDYLSTRCGCSQVKILEVIDTPSQVEEVKKKGRKAG